MSGATGRSATLAVLVLLLTTTSAGAHAELVGSEPAAGANLATTPARVQLLFSEPIAARFFTLRVYDASGARVDRGSPRIALSDPRVLEVDLRGDAPGTQTAVWRALSPDGHLARGAFHFTVADGSPGSANPRLDALLDAPANAVPGGVDTLLRWILFLALFICVGGLWFRAVVQPVATVSLPDTRRGDSIIAGAAILALLAQVSHLVVQTALTADLPLPDVLRGEALGEVLTATRFGFTWMLRSLLLLALVGALLTLRPDVTRQGYDPVPRHNARLAWLLAGLGSATLATLSAGGHAANLGAEAGVAIALDTVHLTAGSIWIGGLAQLVGCHLLADTSVLRRFKVTAATCLLLLVLSGTHSALLHVPSWTALSDTAYGATLAGKLLVVLPLLGLAAANALRIRQALIRTELALAAGVLAVTALLVTMPPATGLVRATPFRDTQAAGDFAIDLVVSPNQAGPNQVTIAVRTAPGAAREIQRVTISAAMRSMDMPERRVAAEPVGLNQFVVTEPIFPMAGDWITTVAVAAGGATEASAVFGLTVGQPPSSHRPAFSPAQLILSTTLLPGADGIRRPNWALFGSLFAFLLGLALLRASAATKRTAMSSERLFPREPLVITAAALIMLAIPLGGISILDAYQRATMPIGSLEDLTPVGP